MKKAATHTHAMEQIAMFVIWNSMLFNQTEENTKRKENQKFMQQNVTHIILHVFFLYLTVFYCVSLCL